MNTWGSCKARTLYRALLKIGWSLKREGKRAHRILERCGFPDFTFAFHDADEVGPRMLARVAKHTGLSLSDI